jgi:hypothetical protein
MIQTCIANNRTWKRQVLEQIVGGANYLFSFPTETKKKIIRRSFLQENRGGQFDCGGLSGGFFQLGGSWTPQPANQKVVQYI